MTDDSASGVYSSLSLFSLVAEHPRKTQRPSQGADRIRQC